MSADAHKEHFWDAELRRFLPDPASALEEALGYVCCPICYVLADMPFNYFSVLPKRWEAEPVLRQTVCRAIGFCNHHTWRLNKMQSLLVIARVYPDVLAAQLSAETAPEVCPLCRLQGLAEDALFDVFVERLAEADKREEYRDLFGLCYHHLHLLLARDLADAVRDAILESQAERGRALIRLLHAFVEKNEVPARWSRTDAEKRAPGWALLKTAGNADV